jgi:hypothetical protein
VERGNVQSYLEVVSVNTPWVVRIFDPFCLDDISTPRPVTPTPNPSRPVPAPVDVIVVVPPVVPELEYPITTNYTKRYGPFIPAEGQFISNDARDFKAAVIV